MESGCPREIATGLSILALEDLVVLVGMHIFCVCRVLIALHYTLIDSSSCSNVVTLMYAI